MQVSPEIKASVNNIRYYIAEIHKANSKQFDLDIESSYKLGEKMREDKLLGDVRVKLTGEIGNSCEVMLLCCQNIERQVEIAEGQDKKG